MSVEIQKHNKRVLASLEPGDAVEIKRGNFAHWALYIGDERVIHLTKENKGGCEQLFTLCGATFDKAFVEEANFVDVARDSKAYKNNSKDWQCRPSHIQEILHRARSKIGKIEYNVLWSNCEHFVSFCRYGVKISEQVQTWLKLIIAVGGTLLGVAMVVLGRRRTN